MIISRNVVMGALALFAMFFGSGNIVFPLLLGQKLGSDWIMAFVGFCISGVFIPFAGVMAVVMLNGNSDKFFAPLNNKLAIFLQFFILTINGPFGVVPRCVCVAYGGLRSINDNICLFIFSLIFCCITGCLIAKREQIMPIISKILSPIKFISLIGLVFVGILLSPYEIKEPTVSISALKDGIFHGYLTMDLCGAIFFASLIMGYIKKIENTSNNGNSKYAIKEGLKISILSGILLCFVYLGFFVLSVMYHNQIQNLSPELILPTIIEISLGRFSKYLLSVTIIIACLTTAVAFLSTWVIFVANQLKNIGINYSIVVIIGIAITFATSLLSFNQILSFMMPVVHILYPLLVILTFYNIISMFFRK